MKKRFTDEQIVGFLREADPSSWHAIGVSDHPHFALRVFDAWRHAPNRRFKVSAGQRAVDALGISLLHLRPEVFEQLDPA